MLNFMPTVYIVLMSRVAQNHMHYSDFRFGTSKMHLSPLVAYAAVRSKAVVLLLLTCCLLLLPL